MHQRWSATIQFKSSHILRVYVWKPKRSFLRGSFLIGIFSIILLSGKSKLPCQTTMSILGMTIEFFTTFYRKGSSAFLKVDSPLSRTAGHLTSQNFNMPWVMGSMAVKAHTDVPTQIVTIFSLWWLLRVFCLWWCVKVALPPVQKLIKGSKTLQKVIPPIPCWWISPRK